MTGFQLSSAAAMLLVATFGSERASTPIPARPLSPDPAQPMRALAAKPAAAPAAGAANTRTLRSFGAIGDGAHDDSAALRSALRSGGGICLSGEGRRYKVIGTLRTGTNICLRDATLIQAAPKFDTRPYISGKPCPVSSSPDQFVDCGDPAMSASDLQRVRAGLSVRTLFVRPDRDGTTVSVRLERVKVDRGPDPDSGSASDAAGIWIDHAEPVIIDQVEITGGGRGSGLQINSARNVTINRLNVHDLVWAPYAGDAPLRLAATRAAGWNSLTVRDFLDRETKGQAPKFYGARIQEQLACVLLRRVTRLRMINSRISHCMARFDVGDLPWQADGMTIGGGSADLVLTGVTVDNVWEGIDVVAGGTGIDGMAIDGARIDNIFTYGIKVGYKLHNLRITNPVIRNVGISGINIRGAVEDASVSGAVITDVGDVWTAGSVTQPWPLARRTGIDLNHGRVGDGTASMVFPNRVSIRNSSVARKRAEGSYRAGFFNAGATNVTMTGSTASGFKESATHGIEPGK